MKKYLPSLIFGTVALIAVAALFVYLDRRSNKAHPLFKGFVAASLKKAEKR